MPDHDGPAAPSRLSRRTVLRGAGVAGVGVPLLAACGARTDLGAQGGQGASGQGANGQGADCTPGDLDPIEITSPNCAFAVDTGGMCMSARRRKRST